METRTRGTLIILGAFVVLTAGIAATVVSQPPPLPACVEGCVELGMLEDLGDGKCYFYKPAIAWQICCSPCSGTDYNEDAHVVNEYLCDDCTPSCDINTNCNPTPAGYEPFWQCKETWAECVNPVLLREDYPAAHCTGLPPDQESQGPSSY